MQWRNPKILNDAGIKPHIFLPPQKQYCKKTWKVAGLLSKEGSKSRPLFRPWVCKISSELYVMEKYICTMNIGTNYFKKHGFSRCMILPALTSSASHCIAYFFLLIRVNSLSPTPLSRGKVLPYSRGQGLLVGCLPREVATAPRAALPSRECSLSLQSFLLRWPLQERRGRAGLPVWRDISHSSACDLQEDSSSDSGV